jgi:hypothetical protein
MRRARGGGVNLSTLLTDAISPLPALELWYILVPWPGARHDKMIARMKSGRLPSCLSRDQEGVEVTITATLDGWQNGLGWFMRNVKVVTQP